MEAGDEIIVFETYNDPVLAHIVRTMLEDNGIPNFVDENMSYIYPLYNTAMGGVKVKIFAKDFERAKALTAEDNSLKVEELTEEEMNEVDEIVCPYCQSNNVRPNISKSRKFSLLGLAIAIPTFVPVTLNDDCHCFNCGKDFNIPQIK